MRRAVQIPGPVDIHAVDTKGVFVRDPALVLAGFRSRLASSSPRFPCPRSGTLRARCPRSQGDIAIYNCHPKTSRVPISGIPIDARAKPATFRRTREGMAVVRAKGKQPKAVRQGRPVNFEGCTMQVGIRCRTWRRSPRCRMLRATYRTLESRKTATTASSDVENWIVSNLGWSFSCRRSIVSDRKVPGRTSIADHT